MNTSDTLVKSPASRSYVILQNLDAADNMLDHYGTAAATTSNGHKLAPDQILVIEGCSHEGEIRAIKDGTGTGTLLITHDETVV